MPLRLIISSGKRAGNSSSSIAGEIIFRKQFKRESIIFANVIIWFLPDWVKFDAGAFAVMWRTWSRNASGTPQEKGRKPCTRQQRARISSFRGSSALHDSSGAKEPSGWNCRTFLQHQPTFLINYKLLKLTLILFNINLWKALRYYKERMRAGTVSEVSSLPAGFRQVAGKPIGRDDEPVYHRRCYTCIHSDVREMTKISSVFCMPEIGNRRIFAFPDRN